MRDEIIKRLLENEELADIPVMTLIRVMTALQEIVIKLDESEKECEKCTQCHNYTE
nr:MAG TPA: Photosynthetic reaction centre cytochrome C subunit [Caudoviricetes sp.]